MVKWENLECGILLSERLRLLTRGESLSVCGTLICKPCACGATFEISNLDWLERGRRPGRTDRADFLSKMSIACKKRRAKPTTGCDSCRRPKSSRLNESPTCSTNPTNWSPSSQQLLKAPGKTLTK